MRIHRQPQVWQAKIQQALEAPEASPVDANKLRAAQAVLTRVEQLAGAASESDRSVAARLFRQRGRDGIPDLEAQRLRDADQVTAEALKGAEVPELRRAVDDLAASLLAQDGDAAALSRLLDLKVVLDAGAGLVGEYNRRVRSTPSHKRTAEPVDPKVGAAIDAVAGRIGELVRDARFSGALEKLSQASDWVRDRYEGETAETVRRGAAGASRWLWKAGTRVVEEAGKRLDGQRDQPWYQWAQRAIGRIRDEASSLMPSSVRGGLQDLTDNARALMGSVAGAERARQDPQAVVRHFTDALPMVRVSVDPKADAVAVGMLKEVGAGAYGASGTELFYHRGARELRVHELDGFAARVGLGGTARAFVRNAYGSPEALEASDRWTGVEVGLICAHLACLSGSTADGQPGAKSWTSTVSLGSNVVPITSDQALLDVERKTVQRIPLSEAQVAQIEGALSKAPESAQRWTRLIGRAVSSGAA